MPIKLAEIVVDSFDYLFDNAWQMKHLDDDQVALIAALALRDLAPNASLAIRAAGIAASLIVNMSNEQRKQCIVHAARVTASARRGHMGGTKC